MNFRPITEAQARAIQTILVEECGYKPGEFGLVDDIRTDVLNRGRVCAEYRFCGSLGFGGKFRNNGSRDNTPYVDFYPEDSTQQRLAAAGLANARIARLFEGAP